MKELYELKEMLCDELKEYGKKGDLTAGSLDVIDKLAHALKSVETIIAMEDAGGYSGRYDSGYNRGSSYAGRRYAKRDSMGRYSRAEEMDSVIEQLREAAEDAPNDSIRQEIHRVVSKIEKM